MNSHEEILEAANEAFGAEDYDRVFLLLNPLAELDVPAALSLLGVMYQLGFGVPKELSKAISLLDKACQLGDGVAAHNLGTIYAMGEDGVEIDMKRSVMYYRKAKELGAQFAPDEFYE